MRYSITFRAELDCEAKTVQADRVHRERRASRADINHDGRGTAAGVVLLRLRAAEVLRVDEVAS